MAETVLLDLPTESRKKFEQLITELVHQRDVTRSMIDDEVEDVNDLRWLYLPSVWLLSTSAYA
jgi:dynein heavy chain 1